MRLRWAVMLCACGAHTGFATPGRAQEDGFWLPVPLESLQTRARADSNDPMAHHLLALAHMNDERWDAAAQRFREALTIDPRFAPAHLGLAILPFARDERMNRGLARGRMRDEWEPILEQSYRDYRFAFVYDPLVELAAPGTPRDTLQSIPRWLFRSTEFAFAGAEAAFLRGDYRRAYGALQWIINQHKTYQVQGPVPSIVLWYQAITAARLGSFTPAIEDLQVLLERSEREEASDSAGVLLFLYTNDLRYLLGFFQASGGQTWNAVRTFRQVLTYDLGYWMAHVRLAELHERRKETEAALRERELALGLNPDDATLVFELGAALGRAGHLDSAAVVLGAAANANPRAALPLYYLGAVAWLRNDPAGVRDAFTRFLAIAPSRMEAEIADARERLALVP